MGSGEIQDSFQENLKKLIEAKLEGGEVAAVEKPKKLAPVVDSDGCIEAESGADGRQKKPARHRQVRTPRRSRKRQVAPRPLKLGRFYGRFGLFTPGRARAEEILDCHPTQARSPASQNCRL